MKKKKKEVPVGPFYPTRAADRKQLLFKGGLTAMSMVITHWPLCKCY